MDDALELQRRARAINVLLEQIGVSKGLQNEWWNLTAWPELGDRTPTQAWLAGDHEAVRELVEKWYADSEAVGERLRSDPHFMDLLRSRLEKLGAGR